MPRSVNRELKQLMDLVNCLPGVIKVHVLLPNDNCLGEVHCQDIEADSLILNVFGGVAENVRAAIKQHTLDYQPDFKIYLVQHPVTVFPRIEWKAD